MDLQNTQYKNYRKLAQEEMVEHNPIIKKLPAMLTQKEDVSNFFTQFETEKIILPDEVVQYYDFDIPNCINWDIGDVAEWLKNVVQLPQYTNTFFSNQIDGKNLLHLLPDHLPDINIKDFDHIKILTKFIKDLYNIETDGFDDGDISLLAPKVIRYQYLLIKTRTGHKYEMLSPKEFLILIFMAIPGMEVAECSWDNIDPARRNYNIVLKAARTGTKRLPGEPKDLSKRVSWHDLNKKALYLNENYPFQLKIVPNSL